MVVVLIPSQHLFMTKLPYVCRLCNLFFKNDLNFEKSHCVARCSQLTTSHDILPIKQNCVTSCCLVEAAFLCSLDLRYCLSLFTETGCAAVLASAVEGNMPPQTRRAAKRARWMNARESALAVVLSSGFLPWYESIKTWRNLQGDATRVARELEPLLMDLDSLKAQGGVQPCCRWCQRIAFSCCGTNADAALKKTRYSIGTFGS